MAVSRRESQDKQCSLSPRSCTPLPAPGTFPPIRMAASSCYDICRWCYLKSFKLNPNKECGPHFIFIALHTNRALEILLNGELDVSHIIFTSGVIVQRDKTQRHEGDIRGDKCDMLLRLGVQHFSVLPELFFFFFGIESRELNSKRRKRWISFQVARSEERVHAFPLSPKLLIFWSDKKWFLTCLILSDCNCKVLEKVRGCTMDVREQKKQLSSGARVGWLKMET